MGLSTRKPSARATLGHMNTELLAPCDAGRLLGLTTSGVIKLARRGALRELRDSQGRRLFERKDVADLVARRKARGAAKDQQLADGLR